MLRSNYQTKRLQSARKLRSARQPQAESQHHGQNQRQAQTKKQLRQPTPQQKPRHNNVARKLIKRSCPEGGWAAPFHDKLRRDANPPITWQDFHDMARVFTRYYQLDSDVKWLFVRFLDHLEGIKLEAWIEYLENTHAEFFTKEEADAEEEPIGFENYLDEILSDEPSGLAYLPHNSAGRKHLLNQQRQRTFNPPQSYSSPNVWTDPGQTLGASQPSPIIIESDSDDDSEPDWFAYP
ncbi:hypothetical protein QBC46DRAFT_433215 [Diplogelasinospora grovesii]|uniref:Uncharacterized protein n=1 Tax=Diplogelasinospora grovesii TaxID=303347 RepID=A0AAN6S5N3_9PEZI|nr:hypothetical protein QBC46DRAFT_433215 [Diplogelasinospora grovesii]